MHVFAAFLGFCSCDSHSSSNATPAANASGASATTVYLREEPTIPASFDTSGVTSYLVRMFVAPGLLYVHVPRTGGTFVTNNLDRFGIGSRDYKGMTPHDGVRNFPDGFLANRIVFGTIRDPWSWYFSFYKAWRNPKSGVLEGPLGEYCGNKATFKDALRAMTRPSETAFRSKVRLQGHKDGIDGLGRILSTSGIGLYSFYIINSYCLTAVEGTADLWTELSVPGADLPWSVDVLIDCVDLEQGMAKLLRAWNGSKATEMANYFLSAHPINEGIPPWSGIRPNGRPDPRAYDEEMVSWVEGSDGWIISRFGFDKPFGARDSFHILERQ